MDLQPAVTSPTCLVNTRSSGHGSGLDTYHNMTGHKLSYANANNSNIIALSAQNIPVNTWTHVK